MAYSEKYYHEYYDSGNNLNRVEIHEIDYTGSAEMITSLGGSPVTVSHEGGDFETTVILGRELSFEFFCHPADANKYDSLFESSYKDHLIKWFVSGVQKFEGYVKPEQLSRAYQREKYVITLSATDALADLRNIEFRNVGVNVTEKVSCLQAIKYALNHIDIEKDIIVQLGTYESNRMTSTECALKELVVDGRRFIDSDSQPMMCHDVIAEILKPFGVFFWQDGSNYVIRNFFELDSYEFLYDYSTLTEQSRTATDNIVDIDGYSYNVDAELSKIRPLNKTKISFLNKDMGGDVTGMDLTDWSNGSIWTIVASDGYTTDGDTLIISSNDNTDYVETAEFAVSKVTDNDYLKITFDTVLESFTAASGVLGSFIVTVEITTPDDVTYQYTFLSENWNSYESALSAATKVTSTGNYKIKISYIQPTGADTWTTAEIKLKNVAITKVYNNDEGNTESYDNVLYDELYVQSSGKGYDLLEQEMILGDGGQNTSLSGYLYDAGSAYYATVDWRSYGGTEDIPLMDIYSRYALNNRYSYKNSLAISIRDKDNTIDFGNILYHSEKYYVPVSFIRHSKHGLVECRLVELITTAQSYDSINHTYLNSIDGTPAVSSRTVNSSVSSVTWSELSGKPTWITSATDVGKAFVGLTNPSAVTFIRINADNTVTARSAAELRTDLSVPSISGTPADNRLAVWTSPTAIEGATDLVYNATGLGVKTDDPKSPLHLKGSAYTVAYNSRTGLFIDSSGVTAGDGNFGTPIEFSVLESIGRKRAAIVPVQTGSDQDELGLAFHISGSTGYNVDLTEAMRIDAYGNVGIGVTNPAFLVTTTANMSNNFDPTPDLSVIGAVIHGAGTGQANLYLHRDDITIGDGDVIGAINFTGADADYQIGASIQAIAGGSWGSVPNAKTYLIFSTAPGGGGPTERVRIDSDGNVLINTTTNSGYKFDVDGTGRFTGNLYTESALEDSGFSSGWMGDKYQIDNDGNAEFESMMIRGGLTVWELILNRLHYQDGGLIIGAGGGKVATIETATAGSEVVTFEDPEGNTNLPFTEGAIVMCQDFDLDRTTVVKKIVREVDSITGDEITFKETTGWATGDDTGTIAVGDEMVAIGHVSDTGLDSFIYMSAVDSNNPFLRIMDGVDAYNKFSLTDDTGLRLQLGNLNGVYGYSTDIFGLAAGDPNNEYMTVDPTNGIRFFNDSNTKVAELAGSSFLVGSSGSNRIEFNGTTFTIQATTYDLSASNLSITSTTGIEVGSDFWKNDKTFQFGGGVLSGDDTSVDIGGWTVNATSIYTGTEYLSDGYASDGITLVNDGSLHSQNFYINSDGEIGVRARQIIYALIETSDTVILSHDAEASTALSSYSKLKTITLGTYMRDGLTLRLKFDLKTTDSGVTVYGRVYKNGAAVGTERSTTSTSYVTYSEDIADWDPSDEIQLYAKTDGGAGNAYVQNFRVCGTLATTVNEITGTNS